MNKAMEQRAFSLREDFQQLTAAEQREVAGGCVIDPFRGMSFCPPDPISWSWALRRIDVARPGAAGDRRGSIRSLR